MMATDKIINKDKLSLVKSWMFKWMFKTEGYIYTVSVQNCPIEVYSKFQWWIYDKYWPNTDRFSKQGLETQSL